MLLSSLCNQGINTSVKYNNGYHHYLWWSLKKLFQFLLLCFFFPTKSTNYDQDTFCAMRKISQQPVFCLWSLKLNLSSGPPWHQMSSFPSPPRLWETSFSLLKCHSRDHFGGLHPYSPCRSLFVFLPPTQMSTAPSLRTSWSLLILSSTYIDTDISPSWVLRPSTLNLDCGELSVESLYLWRVHLCIQATPDQGINFIPRRK